MTGLSNILAEWIFFLACLTIMIETRDAWALFQRHPSNLLLFIPAFTILVPTLFRFPLYVPVALVVPHLIYLIIFIFSVLLDLRSSLRISDKNRLK